MKESRRCESVSNNLLAHLPADERLAGTILESTKLTFGDVLIQPGEPIRHVYFPEDSFVSLIALADRRFPMEVGLIGNDGMLGVPLVLGVDVSPLRAVVHRTGRAWRMDVGQLRRLLRNSTGFRTVLQGYTYVVMAQMAQVAACTCFHSLQARLARCLLMAHDRAHSDHFYLTHGLLADTLGVRRSGVSTAAGLLQSQGLIHYSRGHITIIDRSGLERTACSCYQELVDLYSRVTHGDCRPEQWLSSR